MGGEREGAKRRDSPGAGGGDTKNLGSADQPASELPHPSFNEQPRKCRPARPRNRRRWAPGISRTPARLGCWRGLRAGVGGWREASAAATATPANPSAQPRARPRDPGVRVATPTRLLGPTREDPPGSRSGCGGAPHARDLPADLLGKGAALGHGC